MAMNVDFKGVEAGGLLSVTSSVTFVAGRAVRMGTTGVTTPSAATRVIGLIKEHMISGVVDEINGQFGIYGAKKASVLLQGVATVQQSVFNGTSYSVYDEARSYDEGDVIWANTSTGILTNTNAPQSGTTADGLTSCRVGIVLKAPSNPANGDPMQLSVFCGN
jgi:hypothetical protein